MAVDSGSGRLKCTETIGISSGIVVPNNREVLICSSSSGMGGNKDNSLSLVMLTSSVCMVVVNGVSLSDVTSLVFDPLCLTLCRLVGCCKLIARK